MTKNGVPLASSTPASMTSTMNSPATRAASLASRSNRSRSSARDTVCACITLSAQRRSVPRCTTSYTAPIAPVPTTRTTR
jgi:hypothetical protein